MRVTITQLSDDRFSFSQEWQGLARHVSREKSDLVVLPELIFYPWWFIEDMPDESVMQAAWAAHQQGLADLDSLGVPFAAGSTMEKLDDGTWRNAGFIREQGRTHLGGRKAYLPDEPGFYEARWYGRGDKSFPLLHVGDLRAGFMICSDMWFMDGARMMGRRGANIILSPRCSEGFTLDRWLAGARTAAIISGAYLVSTNRFSPDRLFGGGSWIIDPDGEVMAATSAITPFVTIDIDLAAADKAKLGYPRYIAD
jgi:N-carbamoylputrescine amidase